MSEHEHTIASWEEITAPCPPGPPSHTTLRVLRCACGFVDVWPMFNYDLTTAEWRLRFQQELAAQGLFLNPDTVRGNHLAEVRRAVASGAGHECEEWRDHEGRCQLCGSRR